MSGHGHGHGHHAVVRPSTAARTAVLVLIAVAVLAALLVVLHWWPDGAAVRRVQGALPATAAGVRSEPARLLTVRAACGGSRTDPAGCGDSTARLIAGGGPGRVVRVSLTPDVLESGLRPGDRVLLYDLGSAGGWAFDRADRAGPLLLIAALFAVLVVAVALRRGLMALLGLGFAGAVVVVFLIPALLVGHPPVPVTAAACTLILVVILYAAHGPGMRTSVALLGALAGLGLSVAAASGAVLATRLAGIGDDAAELLVQNAPAIGVQQLVVASVIVAGLGALNDVTVTQASAVWELRDAAPTMSRGRLFRSAMRIGRDHVASTVYTLVFAYLGTALVLLVAVQLYRGSPLDLITSEDVAAEVVRALVGGIGVVLAMPATTLIAVLVVGGEVERDAAVPRYARRSALG